ncbi:DENN domain-containing protein 3 [Chanos chanos]|uniref:DENN domain-containing protein 3 n=1 Tax=Chanos chanos TaxID=29144 RepID=A0A6J2W219_CHACN|nr:DENN domain-containing protein 3-like [Chanos chanos]
MSGQLLSGLLEACIVVGASNDKLREVYEAQQEGRGVRHLVLEPEVLQVHAPTHVPKTNENYEEFCHQRRRSFLRIPEKQVVTPCDVQKEEGVTEDVSVPKDIDLVALPHLCFPGGLEVSCEQRDDRFHFLVFTDVCGDQTHGVVLQHYRPIQVGNVFQERSTQQNGHWSDFRPRRLYTAYGICVVSKHPYYNALRDCLSCLLDQLKTCKKMRDFKELVRDFSDKLALVPIPPPGELHVMFNLQSLMIVLPPREDKDQPVVDLDLHLPFLCFKPRELLQIITGILTEQRLVLFSSDWARLTLVAQCFMLYIRPLCWQLPFVPILSHQMLDFVMAPTGFLMGCHLNHYKEVATETDDSVLINIDDGTVSSSQSECVDLPNVPVDASQCFETRWAGLQLHYDLDLIHHGTCTNINDLRMHRQQWQQSLNGEIQKMMLELMVNIFRDVTDHLNYEHRVFNTDEFLKARYPKDRPFYKKVLETQIFQPFLRDLLDRKQDAFARMEVHTRSDIQRMKSMTDGPRRPTVMELVSKYCNSENRSQKTRQKSLPNLGEERNSVVLSQLPLKKGVSDTLLKVQPKPALMFKLPEFPSSFAYHCVQQYYKDVVNLLERSIVCVPQDNSTLLARYYYLRCFMNAFCGKRLEALRDINNLYKTDIDILPGELVKRLVHSLTKEERTQAEQCPELKHLVGKVKREEEQKPAESDKHVKKFSLPKSSMSLEDFVKVIQESGIVKQVPTIRQLFNALTLGQSQKQINPELFRIFYTVWKETEAEAEQMELPEGVAEHLDSSECVYKLSSSVRTSLGVGKIAMSQKRLFLLTVGRQGFVEIAKFRDIEHVEVVSSLRRSLRSMKSLRIKTCMKKDTFEANLKSECDLWNLIVREMWAGRTMADEHKDPQYVQQALTNVLLMDAVVGCLPSQKAIYAASKLSSLDKIRQAPVMVPTTTTETLQHKISPSLDLPAPEAVNALLYIPGQLTVSDSDPDDIPKLFCALSQGKLVVFDAATWSIEQQCIQLGTAQLNCMLGLNREQVWIGSEDSVIYIINARTLSYNKQLTEHRSDVMDFALEDRKSVFSQAQVYSCSVDGTVIVWDVPTLKMKRQFHVTCDRLSSIQIYNGSLWCGARDCITELKKTGLQYRKICLPQDPKKMETYFSSFVRIPESGQIWTCYADSSVLYVWNDKDFTKPQNKVKLPHSYGITCMIRVKNQIWVGCQSRMKGKIFVVNIEELSIEKELLAHTDSVLSLCTAEDRYVLSGSGSQDGKIAIWKV